MAREEELYGVSRERDNHHGDEQADHRRHTWWAHPEKLDQGPILGNTRNRKPVRCKAPANGGLQRQQSGPVVQREGQDLACIGLVAAMNRDAPGEHGSRDPSQKGLPAWRCLLRPGLLRQIFEILTVSLVRRDNMRVVFWLDPWTRRNAAHGRDDEPAGPRWNQRLEDLALKRKAREVQRSPEHGRARGSALRRLGRARL
jgi:hypothetical protein